jgi:hypothetical protein
LRPPPAILFHSIPAPPVVWRADTGFFHDAERSAADVIRYEQVARGHALDLSPAHVRELEDYEAQALLWVTFTREDALRYARAEDVTELRLDIPAYVIAKDGQGGFLLFFPDDLTETTGGAAMADRFKDPAAEVPDEVAAAREAKRERLAGEIAEHQHAAAVLIGKDDDQSFLQFVHAEAKAAKLTELGGGVPPHLPQPEDEDEQKRRAGRGGGDMGNPADANLGANIRPEVGSGPGGLETFTTQKSADYRAHPEAVDASDFLRGLLAEAERNANPPKLTLEAIAADPWNAVELPLPANADKELLTAARSASEYCADGHHELMMKARAGEYAPPGWTGAEGEPGAHEYDEGRWFQADTRLGEINEALDKIEGRGVYAEGARPDYAPPITNAERDVFLLALRNHPPEDSVYEVLEAELAPTQANHALPSTDEALRALLPDNGVMLYPWPQTFGQALEQIERGWTANDATESDMAKLPSPQYPQDMAARAAYEDARQSAERRADPQIMTLEAIAADPWNAVELPLPGDADKELLTVARDAAQRFADLPMKEGGHDPAPWHLAELRVAEVGERLDQLAGRDPVRQQADDESTKRQDAERAARSGESVPGASPSTDSDFISNLLSEAKAAKAERDTESAELVTQDHGEGKTPGGGRGMF